MNDNDGMMVLWYDGMTVLWYDGMTVAAYQRILFCLIITNEAGGKLSSGSCNTPAILLLNTSQQFPPPE
jgi:hypothetical protein